MTALSLGSARVSRAGFRVPPKWILRRVLLSPILAKQKKVRDREDAFASTRDARAPQNLFEQPPQILKHVLFFVRARVDGEKELLAQVQCLSLHSRGFKPVLYRSQELTPAEKFLQLMML